MYLFSNIRNNFLSRLPQGEKNGTQRQNFGQMIHPQHPISLKSYLNLSTRLHPQHSHAPSQQRTHSTKTKIWSPPLHFTLPHASSQCVEKYEHIKWEIFMKILCKLSETICSNFSAHFMFYFFLTDLKQEKPLETVWEQLTENSSKAPCLCVCICVAV